MSELLQVQEIESLVVTLKGHLITYFLYTIFEFTYLNRILIVTAMSEFIISHWRKHLLSKK